MNLEDQIREEILEGVLPPGSKINISMLKKRYQVSLTPLREALARLTSAGLLSSEVNKGFYVTPMSETELLDLYQTSAHLEKLALVQAIEKGGGDWEEEIVAALYHLGRVETLNKKPSYEEWLEVNSRFHNALVSSCSPVVKELRALLHMKMSRYVRMAFGKVVTNFKGFHEEHRGLAEAILAKDIDLACDLMEKHIFSGRDILVKNLKTGSFCE